GGAEDAKAAQRELALGRQRNGGLQLLLFRYLLLAGTSKIISRLTQDSDDSRFADRMAGVRNNFQLRLGPGAMKLPGAHYRTNNVVPALHDDARNSADTADVLDQIIVSREEGVVHEVVAFNASEGQGELGVAKFFNHRRIEEEFRGAALPNAPGARRFQSNRSVV